MKKFVLLGYREVNLILTQQEKNVIAERWIEYTKKKILTLYGTNDNYLDDELISEAIVGFAEALNDYHENVTANPATYAVSGAINKVRKFINSKAYRATIQEYHNSDIDPEFLSTTKFGPEDLILLKEDTEYRDQIRQQVMDNVSENLNKRERYVLANIIMGDVTYRSAAIKFNVHRSSIERDVRRLEKLLQQKGAEMHDKIESYNVSEV